MRIKEKNAVAEKLQKHMKYFYDEATFYECFKISRKDFVEKLDNAKDEKKLTQILDIVYKGQKQFGRRGVLSLKASTDILKQKIKQRERETKFAQKFGQNVGMTSREFRQQGGMKGMQGVL